MARKLYGPVNSAATTVDKIYGPVNSTSTVMNKLYGSTGGVAKTIHQRVKRINHFGSVLYYSQWESEWTAQDELDVTINSIDEEKFSAFAANYGVDTSWGQAYFDYYDDQWHFYDNASSVVAYIPDNLLLATTGIDATLASGVSTAAAEIERTYVIDFDSPIIEKRLLNWDEFENLTLIGLTGDCWTIGGEKIPAAAVYGYVWGEEEYIDSNTGNNLPDFFLQGNENLEYLSPFPKWLKKFGNYFMANWPKFNMPIDTSNVTSLGNGFLFYMPLFNQPLDFSNLTYIGGTCLKDLPVFNQDILLPSTLTYVGSEFLFRCPSMTSTVTCEAAGAVAAADSGTFATETPTDPCYVEGIKLDGINSWWWNSVFPASNVSPYRKLVILV